MVKNLPTEQRRHIDHVRHLNAQGFGLKAPLRTYNVSARFCRAARAGFEKLTCYAQPIYMPSRENLLAVT